MKSILVADDEYDIALALKLILEDEGYAVNIVSNGQEALNEIARIRPHLVVLDVMMPVLTGLETLLLIRAQPSNKNLPVIIMSAVTPKVKKQSYQWNDFIKKPFNVADFLKIVKKLLAAPVNVGK